VLNAKIIVGGRVMGIHRIADTRRVQIWYRSIPTNIYEYGYELRFVSLIWIRELYIRVLPTRLSSLLTVTTGRSSSWRLGWLLLLAWGLCGSGGNGSRLGIWPIGVSVSGPLGRLLLVSYKKSLIWISVEYPRVGDKILTRSDFIIVRVRVKPAS
jgi:hypothetical protein